MPNQFSVSLWGDEAFSAVLSSKSIPDILRIIARDTSPPLYNLSEHVWFGLFGNSEVAIRALSFFYFLIAVFFAYKIAEKLWDRKTGALAAALTFLNPFLFTYAFEGRMYSLLAATVTASMYFFVSRKWRAYAIATALALYTHHFAMFAVISQGLWIVKEFLFGKRKIAREAIRYMILAGLIYAPWLPILYNQTKMVAGGFWLGRPTVGDIFNLINKYVASGINHTLAKPALFVFFATLTIRRAFEKINETAFLYLWLLGPILMTWIISQKFTPIFFDRYLLYTIPAAMIIIASNRRDWSKITLGVLITLFLIMDIFYFTNPTKKPFSELADYLKDARKGDDVLINWNGRAHHLWESKYYGVPAPIYIPNDNELPFFVGTALMEEGDVIRELPKRLPGKAKVDRVGVITSDEVADIELANYIVEESKSFGELKVVWFRPR